MSIKRNDKLVSNAELSAFFDDFESRSTVMDDGSISFPFHYTFDDLEDLLPDAFSVKPPIRRKAAIRLFRKALYQARRVGPLTADSLIEQARQLHHEERAIPLKTFTLWTKIRAREMGHTQSFRFRWDDVSIHTVANLPKWLRLEPFHNSDVGDVHPDQPETSGYVVLACRERQEDDAVDRMLDALQVIMALINLYETRGRWTLLSGCHWTAGKLRSGPFQFVFEEREFLGESRIWYDPNYHAVAWNTQIPSFREYLKAIPPAKRALLALADHPLKKVIVTALELMQDAFDTRDGNHRLLRFWAALEKLYVEDTARDRSNQKVIDRATFADENYRLTRWKLSHISRVRNQHVHARGHQESLVDLSQTLQDLLTRHLLHWIFHGRDFADHQDLLAYVDLPRNDDALRKLRNAVERRLKLNKAQRAK